MNKYSFGAPESCYVSIRYIRAACGFFVHVVDPPELCIARGDSELAGLPFANTACTSDMQRAHEVIPTKLRGSDMGYHGRGRTRAGGFGAPSGQSIFLPNNRTRKSGITYEPE